MITAAFAAFALMGLVFAGVQVVADDHDDEDAATAGGGGHFSSMGRKDTFGFYLEEGNPEYSSIVLHARGGGYKVQIDQFDSILFEYDVDEDCWTAHAYGTTWIAGWEYDYHFMVTDMGKGKNDMFMLEVALVGYPNYKMIWEADGLDGGNIWVHAD